MRRDHDPFSRQDRLRFRFTDAAVEDERRLGQILLETGAESRPRQSAAQAEPGDLRGIPVIAMGVGGTSPGSDPFLATWASMARQERQLGAAELR